MGKLYRSDETFVVRIWSEEGGASADDAWRASVTNVTNAERRYFTAYPDLVAFLERWRNAGERRP